MDRQEDDSARPAVQITVTAADLIQAQRLHFWQYMRSRAGVTRLITAWAAAAVVFAMVMKLLGGIPALLPSAICIAIIPFIIVGSWSLRIYGLGGWKARRTFRAQKTLQRPFRISWTDRDVSFESEFGHTRFQWSDFFKIRENHHCILLYQSRLLYQLIPKSAFKASELEDFRSAMLGWEVRQ